METYPTARDYYEQATEDRELTAAELAQQLREQANQVRAGETIDDMREDVSADVEVTLETPDEEVMDRIAKDMDETAQAVESTLKSDTVVKELPQGVAGQAELGTDNVWVDPEAIMSGAEEQVIDETVARNVAVHEEEHTKQSQTADQATVTVGNRTFDATEVREAGAILEQDDKSFLSAEYQSIDKDFGADPEDQRLIRAGRFRELEAKKNGGEVPQALAA